MTNKSKSYLLRFSMGQKYWSWLCVVCEQMNWIMLVVQNISTTNITLWWCILIMINKSKSYLLSFSMGKNFQNIELFLLHCIHGAWITWIEYCWLQRNIYETNITLWWCLLFMMIKSKPHLLYFLMSMIFEIPEKCLNSF